MAILSVVDEARPSEVTLPSAAPAPGAHPHEVAPSSTTTAPGVQSQGVAPPPTAAAVEVQPQGVAPHLEAIAGIESFVAMMTGDIGHLPPLSPERGGPQRTGEGAEVEDRGDQTISSPLEVLVEGWFFLTRRCKN